MNSDNCKLSSPDLDDLWEIVRKANEGDSKALIQLERELAGSRSEALISVCGNLAFQAQESLLSKMMGDNQANKIILRHTLDQMRLDLGWNKSNKLEQMLIERVVLSWLYLHLFELVSIQTSSISLPQSKLDQDRIERANKRYLYAIKSLATVRRVSPQVSVKLKVSH